MIDFENKKHDISSKIFTIKLLLNSGNISFQETANKLFSEKIALKKELQILIKQERLNKKLKKIRKC